MNILITSGGYIGSHTSMALRDARFNPVTYDNLGPDHKVNVKWAPLEIGYI